jgi:hypothetical protein
LPSGNQKRFQRGLAKRAGPCLTASQGNRV